MIKVLLGVALGYGLFTENGKKIMNTAGDKIIKVVKENVSKSKQQQS